MDRHLKRMCSWLATPHRDLIGIVEDPSVLPVKPSLVAYYERCDPEPLASSQSSSQAQMMARGFDAWLLVLLAYPHAVSSEKGPGSRVEDDGRCKLYLPYLAHRCHVHQTTTFRPLLCLSLVHKVKARKGPKGHVTCSSNCPAHACRTSLRAWREKSRSCTRICSPYIILA